MNHISCVFYCTTSLSVFCGFSAGFSKSRKSSVTDKMLNASKYCYASQPGEDIGKLNAEHFEPMRKKCFELAKSVPFPDTSNVFNIGDYGTADGRASANFIHDLIVTLREHHGPDVQFQIIYEDQAINDFNALFKGLMSSDPPSYHHKLDNVFLLASGTNHFSQCVPSNTMHIIISMLSAQWLSKIPVYSQSLYIYPESTVEEKEALNAQAGLDWEMFLLMRSREMRSGGVLVVTVPCERECNDGKRRISGHTFVTALTDVWASFRDTGRITKQEFINTNMPYCAYSLEQIKAPFCCPSSKVLQSGLYLVSSHDYLVGYSSFKAWKEETALGGVGDREIFARRYVEGLRNWSNNIFLCGLSSTRSLQERKDIVDDLYSMVEENLSKIDPELIHEDDLYRYILFRKQ